MSSFFFFKLREREGMIKTAQCNCLPVQTWPAESTDNEGSLAKLCTQQPVGRGQGVNETDGEKASEPSVTAGFCFCMLVKM